VVILERLTLAQNGTREIQTIDLFRYIRQDMVEKDVSVLLDNWGKFGLEKAARGLRREIEIDELLALTGINYEAPVDVTKVHRDGEFDFVYSITVLEHVPGGLLPGIVEACHRLLKPEGMSYHVVTPADHFSWSVGGMGLPPFNYVKYADRVFNSLYNPRIAHQNRWRCSQYLELFSRVGFEVVNLERDVCEDRLAVLDRMKLAPQFRVFDRKDLGTEQFYVLLRRR
jgi:Methyltransferase domain